MNESTQPPLDTVSQPASQEAAPKRNKLIKTSLFLDPKAHQELAAAVATLSEYLGCKVNLSQFMGRTVEEHWKVQLERYHKFGASIKRTNS